MRAGRVRAVRAARKLQRARPTSRTGGAQAGTHPLLQIRSYMN
jgi:hypothetical protein